MSEADTTKGETVYQLGDVVRVIVEGTVNAVSCGPDKPGEVQTVMVFVADGETTYDMHGGWPSGRNIVLPPEALTLLARRPEPHLLPVPVKPDA